MASCYTFTVHSMFLTVYDGKEDTPKQENGAKERRGYDEEEDTNKEGRVYAIRSQTPHGKLRWKYTDEIF